MYKIVIFLISVAFLASCASQNELQPLNKIPAYVTSVKVIIPIYSQRVAFRLPTTWKVAFQDQNPNMFMIEFTPKNEDIKNWNNLISVQGFKNLVTKTNSEQFIDGMALLFKATCGENLVYKKIDSPLIDGYKSTTAILGCSQLPNSHPTGVKKGQSEIGYYVSIEGDKDIYLIQKAIRGNSFEASKSPLKKDNIRSFFEKFMPIELCKNTGHPGVCNK